jgi:hypothetical protein
MQFFVFLSLEEFGFIKAFKRQTSKKKKTKSILFATYDQNLEQIKYMRLMLKLLNYTTLFIIVIKINLVIMQLDIKIHHITFFSL